jgi:TonB family protein
MPKSVTRQEVAAPESLQRPAIQALKRQRLSVFLVTVDDTLWPQIGADLHKDLLLKQVDTIDELLSSTTVGQSGIVLWDARGNGDAAAVLSRLGLHSPRMVIIVLDHAAGSAKWAASLQQRQIEAVLPMPLMAEALSATLASAQEEVNSRLALLGDGRSGDSGADGLLSARSAGAAGGRKRALVAVAAATLLMAGIAVYYFLAQRSSESPDAPGGVAKGSAAASVGAAGATGAGGTGPNGSGSLNGLGPNGAGALNGANAAEGGANGASGANGADGAGGTAGASGGAGANGAVDANGTSGANGAVGANGTAGANGAAGGTAPDEQVDALVEKAQQAMLDRHFIDPLAGSALQLYRDALIIDPNNGEARQGLQRLSGILIARVQSALDERKFDVALQSLETARSIDANDASLAGLDEKIASLRAELGPAQIAAALSAQNFDRAMQLIEEASRAKTLPAAKLAQLRDEVTQKRDEFDAGRLLKLADARLQKDHLIEPRADNAAYYLQQAKQAGASGDDLQPLLQELQRRLTASVHAAVDQRRFSDADKLISALRVSGAPAASTAPLTREVAAARAQPAVQKTDQPQYLELAQARLSQGAVTAPENDSALYYLNQLRAADPKNSGLPALSATVQTQILASARTLLAAKDFEKAEAMVQLAGGIGHSADVDAFNDQLRAAKTAAGVAPLVVEQSLTRVNKLEVQYPARALQDGVEGWVELHYTVLETGAVANVKVTNSSPPKIFDASAAKALSRLRYQPVLQDGKAVAVSTELRVVYRVPK